MAVTGSRWWNKLLTSWTEGKRAEEEEVEDPVIPQ
jgi:hypothetical protein